MGCFLPETTVASVRVTAVPKPTTEASTDMNGGTAVRAEHTVMARRVVRDRVTDDQ
ncbi:hypothetical protein ACFRCW_14865 [Streptomyces sp. NPDC056653]|uniref:hypothetical protein n=1 Tax=Streptomyces sp. NPDC056653 TaxID=3345894 RepID=UPI0036CAFB11